MTRFPAASAGGGRADRERIGRIPGRDDADDALGRLDHAGAGAEQAEGEIRRAPFRPHPAFQVLAGRA